MATKKQLLFVEQLSAIELQAIKHVKSFMRKKNEFRFVSEEQVDEFEFDDTIGIAFYNKHGFEDHAHVVRIYKNTDDGGELWIEGHGYDVGGKLTMPLRDVDAASMLWIADLLN